MKHSTGNGVAKEPTHDPWIWTMLWGLLEGDGVLGGWGQRGKNQDNCNNIINNIQLKSKKIKK